MTAHRVDPGSGAPGLLRRLLLASMLVVGCAPAVRTMDAPTAPPSLSRILTVGEIVSERARAPIVEYELVDGRTLTFDLGNTRLISRGGGEPNLIVSGRDDIGEWVAVIGHQDGTPDGCHVLNQLGHELGSTIAIAGVRWAKAPAFRAGTTPQLGAAYPDGTRFCIDASGRVDDIIPS